MNRSAFVISIVIFTACSTAPEPSPTPEPTATPGPTTTPTPTVTPTQTITPTATLSPTPSVTPTPRVFSSADIPDEFKTEEGLMFDWMARNIQGELKLYFCNEYPPQKFSVHYATWDQGDICLGDHQFWDVGETSFIVFGPKEFWRLSERLSKGEANRVHLVGGIYTFYLENKKVFYWDEAGGPEGNRIEGLSIPFLHCVLKYLYDENIIIWEMSRTQRLSLGSGLVPGNPFGFSLDPDGIKAESCDNFLVVIVK